MAQSENGMAVAGFVCSLLGLISCGILSPIGLIISWIAQAKQKSSLGLAGLVMGIIGSLWMIIALIFGLFAVILGALGIAAGASQGP